MITKKYSLEKIFYLIFSLAVVSRIICDLLLNRAGIHAGEVFPNRHVFSFISIYPPAILYIEMALASAGAILLNLKRVRFGCLLIIISYLMGLSQMFQNQKLLILIVACTLCIQPLSKTDKSSIWFLRYQLILVYSISALQKVVQGFNDGIDLSLTTKYLLSIESNPVIKALLAYVSDPLNAMIFSVSTVVLEFIIPIFLIKRPKIGVALVVLLHFSMNLLMKDIMPFSLTMIALSLPFLMDFDLDK